MTMQAKEELPIRELLSELVSRADGERRLPNTGHAMDGHQGNRTTSRRPDVREQL
jgi:hypothetical protein